MGQHGRGYRKAERRVTHFYRPPRRKKAKEKLDRERKAAKQTSLQTPVHKVRPLPGMRQESPSERMAEGVHEKLHT